MNFRIIPSISKIDTDDFYFTFYVIFLDDNGKKIDTIFLNDFISASIYYDDDDVRFDFNNWSLSRGKVRNSLTTLGTKSFNFLMKKLQVLHNIKNYNIPDIDITNRNDVKNYFVYTCYKIAREIYYNPKEMEKLCEKWFKKNGFQKYTWWYRCDAYEFARKSGFL